MRYELEPINSVWNELDSAFSLLSNRWPRSNTLDTRENFLARVDVSDFGEYYGMSFDLPGLDEKEINIEVEDSCITVSGNRESSFTDENSLYSERSFGSFKRVMRLPKDAKSDDISAEYRNGVLELKVQKLEVLKARKIEVKAS